MLEPARLRERLALAEHAARLAGAALREARERWAKVEAELGREVKIEADRRAEAIILETLQASGDIPILSEERGWVGARGGELLWAVDPLDGSVNYLRGAAHCAVSIGLLEGGVPRAGVVHAFFLDEMYVGAVGLGAFCNGRAIQVSSVDDPGRAVLQTGVPARNTAIEALAADLAATFGRWRKVRMIGSAACALAEVASGRADAYQETGPMLWDVAGGCALVEAAGGRSAWSGEALDAPLRVTAAGPGLAAAVTVSSLPR